MLPDDVNLIHEALGTLAKITEQQLESAPAGEKIWWEVELDRVKYSIKRLPSYYSQPTPKKARLDEYKPVFTAEDEQIVVKALQTLMSVTHVALEAQTAERRLFWQAKLARIESCASRLKLEL